MALMRTIRGNEAIGPTISDSADITMALSKIRVRFENRPVLDDISDGVDDQLFPIDDQRFSHVAPSGTGWGAVLTVVATDESSAPEIAQREAARIRFLGEHFHEDDEVWFFLHGHATFVLCGNTDENIYALLCGPGDFICLPAGIRHRFDMGKLPNFRALRFYRTEPGFVGEFTDTEVPSFLQVLDCLRVQ